MAKNSYERFFTDNSEYDKYEGFTYLKSLALTVQEFLYTKNAENFNMVKHIKLWDFMNLVVYFLSAASSDFGKSTIQSYINDIRVCEDTPFYDESVKYNKAKNRMIVYGASFELVISILWAANVYNTFRWNLNRNERYKEMADMVKEIMMEENHYTVSNFKKLPPIKNTTNAVNYMTDYAVKNELKINVKKQATETPDNTTVIQLQNRISELEAENKALKDNMEKLKASKDGDKLIEEIKRLKEEKENIIVNMLAPIFCGMESNARDFLRKIQGVTDQEVTSLVAELVNNRKISIKSYRRDLWRILHGTNLYGATESNWNLVIKPQIKQTKQ